jgi:hypothetical protein
MNGKIACVFFSSDGKADTGMENSQKRTISIYYLPKNNK